VPPPLPLSAASSSADILSFAAAAYAEALPYCVPIEFLVESLWLSRLFLLSVMPLQMLNLFTQVLRLFFRLLLHLLLLKLSLRLLVPLHYFFSISQRVYGTFTCTHPWTNSRYHTCFAVLSDEGISEYLGELAVSKWEMGRPPAQRPDTLLHS
jgi:hypothetical protein